MNKDDIKKILYIIIGVFLLFIIGYFFIYVFAGLVIVGLIAYIYFKFFAKQSKSDAKKSSTKINNVVMDAEYKEK